MVRLTLPMVLAAALCAASPAQARCRDGDNVSWYGEPQRLRGGGRFDPDAMTCAHPTAPDGSLVKVTMATGRAAVCVVNDAGPAPWTGCQVDVSRRMAGDLGILDRGTGRGTIQIVQFLRLGRAPEKTGKEPSKKKTPPR